jgi:hypothetical protein
MSAKVIGSHILVESSADESDEQFSETMEQIILDIYGHRPDWLKFSPGKRFKRGEAAFREFVCMAGSVALHMMQRASRGQISRAIIYRADVDGVERAYEIRAGRELEFSPDELQAQGGG